MKNIKFRNNFLLSSFFLFFLSFIPTTVYACTLCAITPCGQRMDQAFYGNECTLVGTNTPQCPAGNQYDCVGLCYSCSDPLVLDAPDCPLEDRIYFTEPAGTYCNQPCCGASVASGTSTPTPTSSATIDTRDTPTRTPTPPAGPTNTPTPIPTPTATTCIFF